MSHYAYGYCGMPCALCTRCRTEGSSRCPGCSCDGYYTVPCKVHRCVREKGLDFDDSIFQKQKDSSAPVRQPVAKGE